MNINRYSLLIGLAMILIGIAGIVHTGLNATLAQATPSELAPIKETTRLIELEAAQLAALSQLAPAGGNLGMPTAPVVPAPPFAPPVPAVSVDLTIWITLTALLFAPFALAAWYVDRHVRLTTHEQPLP